MVDKYISGSYDEVQKLVDAYFNEYPKFGYSTKVVSDYVTDAGIRYVHITRYNTCD